ncbi:MAG: helix-turn-helix transcriptional regulator [Bacteroidales bacterium]|nr:helix-turn-helix transcriptional regulator [Bacteroidales bacterium]
MKDMEETRQPLATDSILTPAETRIVIGYVEGLSGKEIAAKNHIAYSTVVTHTQNIYEKAGIQRCTNALVAWFLKTNYRLDLSELGRRIGAFLLLCLVCFQMAVTNFDNSFVRARTARATRTCRKAGRRGRRDDEPTIDEI